MRTTTQFQHLAMTAIALGFCTAQATAGDDLLAASFERAFSQDPAYTVTVTGEAVQNDWLYRRINATLWTRVPKPDPVVQGFERILIDGFDRDRLAASHASVMHLYDFSDEKIAGTTGGAK